MSFNMNLSNRGPAGSGVGGTMTGASKIPKGHSLGGIQQFNPQQMDLFNQLFSHVGPDSYLSKLAGGSQEGFEELEQPSMRQFQQLQGGLASRFSQGGARKSSAFQNVSNQATSDFASHLASQRKNYQQQALRDLMEMSSSLLGQRPYEQFLVQNAPKEPSFLKQLGLGAASGVGSLAGKFLF